MKKLIIAVSLLITLSSCHTGGSSTGSTSVLSSTETQLLGTWYLQKEFDSGLLTGIAYSSGTDTTVTGYSTAFYITFMSSEFGSVAAGGGSNWLQYEGTWTPITAMIPSSTTGNAINDYWYYDNTVNKLDVVIYQCSIITLTSSHLTVQYTNTTGSGTIYSYFTK